MKISDGGDGYTTLWMSVLNATEFNHLKMIKIANFMLYILPQYFERQEIPFPICILEEKWKAVCCYAKWRKWVFIWKDRENKLKTTKEPKKAGGGCGFCARHPSEGTGLGNARSDLPQEPVICSSGRVICSFLHLPILTSCHPKQSSHLAKAKLLVCSLDLYTFFRTWAPRDPLPSSVSL